MRTTWSARSTQQIECSDDPCEIIVTDTHGREHTEMRGRPVSMHAMRGISAHSNGFHTCRALHLLQLLLGLQPDRRRHALETVAPMELPSWAGTIRLSGIRAFGRAWDARLQDGRVRVEEA